MKLSPAKLREHVLSMAFSGQSVHVGCAFSLIEIVTALYSRVLRYDRSRADHPERDLLILSKGHGVMALYAAYRELGWLEEKQLSNYFKDGSDLHGLCEAKIPGLEVSSGSLGHGLPIAAGMALGLKRKKSDRQVYCIVGDGEMNEGPMWEALLFAAHHELGNLTVIVDANDFQAMGRTKEVLGLEPLASKFASFGFEARECDGHDAEAVAQALSVRGLKPRALIARTVKGKGVSFMEANNDWHYLRLKPETMELAMKEIRQAAGRERV